MKTPALIRILQRFFNALFYGEITLFFVVIPLFYGVAMFGPNLFLGSSAGKTRSVTVTRVPGAAPAQPVMTDSVKHIPDKRPSHRRAEPPGIESGQGGWFVTEIIVTGSLHPAFDNNTDYSRWSKFFQYEPPAVLSEKPSVQLAKLRSINPTNYLRFKWSTWSEFGALPWPVVLIFITSLLLVLGGTLSITYCCKRLFDGLSRDGYFETSQIRWLTRIGRLCIGYGLLEFATECLKQWFAWYYLAQHGLSGNYAIQVGWPVGSPAVLLGAIILVLARIFAYGFALKQEHDLTI